MEEIEHEKKILVQIFAQTTPGIVYTPNICNCFRPSFSPSHPLLQLRKADKKLDDLKQDTVFTYTLRTLIEFWCVYHASYHLPRLNDDMIKPFSRWFPALITSMRGQTSEECYILVMSTNTSLSLKFKFTKDDSRWEKILCLRIPRRTYMMFTMPRRRTGWKIKNKKYGLKLENYRFFQLICVCKIWCKWKFKWKNSTEEHYFSEEKLTWHFCSISYI